MKKPSIIIVPPVTTQILEAEMVAGIVVDTNRFIDDGSGIEIIYPKGHRNHQEVKQSFNQPRDPAGSSTGGQWSAARGNAGPRGMAGNGGAGASAIPNASDLTKVKQLGGSTGAALMQDADGNKYVVKYGNSPEHVTSESAVNDIYKAAGVPIPEHKLDVSDPERPAQITAFVPSTPMGELKGDAKDMAIDQVKQHFAVDALVGNWDVIGMVGDNVLMGNDGKAYRVDNGGSLTFRAQGGEKPFGNQVGELDTMRASRTGKPVFGSLTNAEVAVQIRNLEPRTAAIIAATPRALRSTMQTRLQYMVDWASTKAWTFPGYTGESAQDQVWVELMTEEQLKQKGLLD